MKAPIPQQSRVGDATICNQLITSVMFSKTLNVFIYVIFWKLAANVLSLAPVAVFDTDENKYTEKLERKNAIIRKKIFTSAF